MLGLGQGSLTGYGTVPYHGAVSERASRKADPMKTATKTTKLDMHLHTRGSDGQGTPEEIVAVAQWIQAGAKFE